MKRKLIWEAVSNDERNKAINGIKEATMLNGGCIMNFEMFSDLALSLSIEVEGNRIPDLHSSLAKILNISDLDLEQRHKESNKDWLIRMNVSFTKGQGNLKTIVPVVPG